MEGALHPFQERARGVLHAKLLEQRQRLPPGGATRQDFLSALSELTRIANAQDSRGNEDISQGAHKYFAKASQVQQNFLVHGFPILLDECARLDELLGLEGQPDQQTGFRRLVDQKAGSVVLSRRACAALVGACFLCITTQQGGETYPHFHMGRLWQTSWQECQSAKLDCICHYLTTALGKHEDEFVTFERVVLAAPAPDVLAWTASRQPLCRVQVIPRGSMDASTQPLLADFANAFLGGGALGRGCVQEEILFVVKPECLVGLLLCERLADNESVHITGARTYSNSTGYSGGFRWAGPHAPPAAGGGAGAVENRPPQRIAAMDALHLRRHRAHGGHHGGHRGGHHGGHRGGHDGHHGHTVVKDAFESQFEVGNILREANKALVAFGGTAATLAGRRGNGRGDAADGHRRLGSGVATGNWGCGAFGGDHALKSLIQWAAASAAGLDVMEYYAFEDPKIAGLGSSVALLTDADSESSVETVGELWREVLVLYERERRSSGRDLFEWVGHRAREAQAAAGGGGAPRPEGPQGAAAAGGSGGRSGGGGGAQQGGNGAGLPGAAAIARAAAAAATAAAALPSQEETSIAGSS